MEIKRGLKRNSGRSDGKKSTDSKKPGEYVDRWKYGQHCGGPYGRFEGGYIVQNGTKKRSPQRTTELEVWISDNDVCALFNALLERKAEDEQRLREAMRKIEKLLTESNLLESDEASSDVLTEIKTSVRDALYPDQQIVWDCGTGRPKFSPRKSEAPDWNPFREAVFEP
jgi:hypothetical protein